MQDYSLKYPKFEFVSGDRNGDSFVLTEDYRFEFEGKVETAKAGFRCDGVSTPKFLWASVSPKIDNRTIVAGVTHDWIYRIQPTGWSRRDADRMFYRFCRDGGLGWLKSVVAYVGLRLFGGGAWLKDAHDKCPGCRMDCSKCYKHQGCCR